MIKLYIFLASFICAYSQLARCQDNCISADRIVGPTKSTNIRPHPFKIAQFPSKFSQFCLIGCQSFYYEYPDVVSCKTACDNRYRYKLTVDYNDAATEANLECHDGCEIAYKICLPGYYCNNGAMTACPQGMYREGVPGISVNDLKTAHVCLLCPPGTFRSFTKGENVESCSKCPVGRYVPTYGSVEIADCQRCPAGRFGEEEGMANCKCITEDSCDYSYSALSVLNANYTDYFANGIDFDREDVPFDGRW